MVGVVFGVSGGLWPRGCGGRAGSGGGGCGVGGGGGGGRGDGGFLVPPGPRATGRVLIAAIFVDICLNLYAAGAPEESSIAVVYRVLVVGNTFSV